MKVIIGNGKVSNIIKDDEDIILSHSDVEITRIESVHNVLHSFPQDTIVVNTAAKINLEWCEANPNEAEDVNVWGALNIADVCKSLGHRFVHVSSGCIFDGEETGKIFTEEDNPTPAAWYAYTKSKADKLLVERKYDDILIVRPRQLISPTPNPTNMLTKFITLKSGEFIDSPNSITCIEDMKEMINHLIKKRCTGIYNLANVGYLSPFEIALRVKKKVAPELCVEKILYADYLKKIKVKRVNTLLSLDKLISTGYTPRTASDALDWCLDNYGKKL
jgi:dTDP-4-dehydrorhamnose reductase